MEHIKISEWEKYVNKRIAYFTVRFFDSNKKDIYEPGKAQEYIDELIKKRKISNLKKFGKSLISIMPSGQTKDDYEIEYIYDYYDIEFKKGIVFIEDAISWYGLNRYYINKLILPRTFRESIDGALKDIVPRHFVLPIEATINVEDWEKYFSSFQEPKREYETLPNGIDPYQRTITFTYSNPKDILEKLKYLMEAKNKYGESSYIRNQLTILFDGPMLDDELKNEITEFLHNNDILKVEFKQHKLTTSNRQIISEILNTITYIDTTIRDSLLEELDSIINNYYDNYKHQRPNIDFSNEINLTLESPNSAEFNLNIALNKMLYRVQNELNDLSNIALYRKYLFKTDEVLELPNNKYQNKNISQYIINIKRYAVAKYAYGVKYNIVANRINQMLIPLEEYSKEYIVNGVSALGLNPLVDKKYLYNKLSEYYIDVMNDKLGEEELDKSKMVDFNQEYQNNTEFEYHLIDEIDDKIHDLIHELEDDIPGFDYKGCVRDLLNEIDSLEQKAELITIANCLKLIDHDLENDIEVEESIETSVMKDIINIINENKLTGKEREQIYTYIGSTLERSFKDQNDNLLQQLTHVKVGVESYISEKKKFMKESKEFEQNYNNELSDEYHIENENRWHEIREDDRLLSEQNGRIIIRM